MVDLARWHINILESWRRLLPTFLLWKDDDPPATDLNIARLRAKYYGGLYMMQRPYLWIATHVIKYPSSDQSSQRSPQWPHHSPPAATPDCRSAQIENPRETQNQIVEGACQCIESAIRSTVAFDRVGAPKDSIYAEYKSTRTTRLVLPNIFGTLHAQFGNMLVLAAVYKSWLHSHLPANTSLTPINLQALFVRTLDILDEVAPNSPTLKLDAEILRSVRAQLVAEGILHHPSG